MRELLYSEVAVGKAIKPYNREDLFIVTKIPTNEEHMSAPDDWKSKLDTCLERLDTPYIDLLYFHGLQWDSWTSHVSKPGRAFDVAKQAVKDGKVRDIGFSSHDKPENIIKLIDTGEFAGLLVQYNFLDRNNEEVLARAAEKKMGVTVMGPVGGGRLGAPQEFTIDDKGSKQFTTPELALRFVWSNPNVTVCLSGMSEMDHVEHNVRTAEASLEMTPEEKQQIDELVRQNQKMAELYCTGCGYCMPCPNDVNIPENFRYMNWYKVWGLLDQAKWAYNRLSPEGTNGPWIGEIKGLKAEECVECGECEPKCPQNIPIIEQLKEVAATLK